MIKVISLFKRKPELSVEAFTKHWISTHAELVRQVPGIRRYVQSQTIASAYRKGEPIYDGMAELWYDDTAAMRRAADAPVSREAFADNRNFLDLNSFVSIHTEEVIQLDGPTNLSMVKLAEFPIRPTTLTPEEFHRYWSEVHGPLAAKIPQMRRYIQSHARLSSYRDGRIPPFDGVAEVWFDGTDAMRESAKAIEYKLVREDEPNFIDQSKLQFIITRERIII